MRSILPAVTLIVTLMMTLPSTAAVRACTPAVAGDIVQSENELLGKRKAVESWIAKAARAGPGYTRWQLATQRSLVCRPMPAPAKSFACIASAAPCTIQQAPGTRKRRLGPMPGRNVPFEV